MRQIMILSIDTVRDFLRQQFSILPESVRLDTHLRQELALTDSDVKALVRYVSQSVDYSFPEDLLVVSQLIDVFDLMVYVLLRASEERDPPTGFSEPVWPIDGLSTNE